MNMNMSNQEERAASCRKWSGHLYVRGVVTSGPEPRAIVEASETELRISGLLGDFSFSRDEIVSINSTGWFPWGRRALRIEHNVERYPPVILFYPLWARSGDIKTTLARLGYATDGC